MLKGALRVFLAFTATIGMFAFWMVLVVVLPMVIALYISRAIPQTGRRRPPNSKKDRD